ncbi:hypothetical protein JOQ06_014066, partial [Pogonophryne albipinna]
LKVKLLRVSEDSERSCQEQMRDVAVCGSRSVKWVKWRILRLLAGCFGARADLQTDSCVFPSAGARLASCTICGVLEESAEMIV